MKKNLKKLFALLLVVVMVAAMFAGCANNTETPAEPTTPSDTTDTTPTEDTTSTEEPAATEMCIRDRSTLLTAGIISGNVIPR